MGKDGVYDDMSTLFSMLHCGRENRDFWIAGGVRKTLGFKLQQKE
jgi:hypothetical protein